MITAGRVAGLIQAMGGGADPAVIESAVQDWLDQHPEATTTVADGSITEQKLATSIAQKLGLISSLSDEIDGIDSDVTDLKSAINYAEKQIEDNVYESNVIFGGNIEVAGAGNYVFENIFELTTLTDMDVFTMKCDSVTGNTNLAQSMQIHFYHGTDDLVYVSGATSVTSRKLSDYPTTDKVVFRLYPAAGTAMPTGKAKYENLQIFTGETKVIIYNAALVTSQEKSAMQAEIDALKADDPFTTNIIFSEDDVTATGAGSYVSKKIFETTDVPSKIGCVVGACTGYTATNVIIINTYDNTDTRLDNIGIEPNTTLTNRLLNASAVKMEVIFYPAQGTALPSGESVLVSIIISGDGELPYKSIPDSNLSTTMQGLPARVATLEENSSGVSSTIIDEIKTTAKRVNSYGNIEFALLMVTDIHSGGTTKYKTIKSFVYAQRIIGASILANLGDLGFDVNETDAGAYALMQNYKELSNSDVPFITIKGNHDYVASAGITQAVYNAEFVEASRRKYPLRVMDTHNGYGIIMFGESPVKMIYLNTSEGDTQNYTMSQTQLQWLCDTLAAGSANDKFVIVSHMCPYDIGRSTAHPDEANTNPFITLRAILAAYVAKTSGSNWSVNWDFSAGSNGELVCILSGDSHWNNQGVVDGVNTIVRQGYGFSGSGMAEGSTYDDFNRYTEVDFDILCVKTDGHAKIFRIGAGGSARDYAFEY